MKKWQRSYFWTKKTRSTRKKLNCTFIRTNTSKYNFDVDYEASRIPTFISQFKDNKIKEIDNKNKELEDKIKKLEQQLANLGVKNNDVND